MFGSFFEYDSGDSLKRAVFQVLMETGNVKVEIDNKGVFNSGSFELNLSVMVEAWNKAKLDLDFSVQQNLVEEKFNDSEFVIDNYENMNEVPREAFFQTLMFNALPKMMEFQKLATPFKSSGPTPAELEARSRNAMLETFGSRSAFEKWMSENFERDIRKFNARNTLEK